MNQATQDKVRAMQWPILEPLETPGPSRPVALNRPVCVAGARPDINFTIVSPQVSRTHAIFVTDGSAVYIRDLVSLNRVYINDVPVRETTLANGDLLRLGPVSFRCHSGFNRSGKQDVPLAPLDLYEVDSGRDVSIHGYTAVVGSRDGCDVRLEQDDVEQVHAVIFGRDGRWFVRDLRSRTHTFVNEAPVAEAELKLGDALRIGITEFRCGPMPEADPQLDSEETFDTAEALDVPAALEAIVPETKSETEDFLSPSPSEDLMPEPQSEEPAQETEHAAELPDDEPHADRLEALALELSEDLKADVRVTRQLKADELEASELLSEEAEAVPLTAEAVVENAPEDDWANEAKSLATSASGEATESVPLRTQSNQEEAELAFSELLDKVVGDVQRVQSAWQELIAIRHTPAARLDPEVGSDSRFYPLSNAKHERSSREE